MSFGMKQARALVDAGIRAAEEKGYLVTVTVVDAGGNFMWAGRMDGTKFVAPDIARGKAFAAAAFRQSTGGLEEKANPKPVFYAGVQIIHDGRMAIGQGGLPIWMDGEVVGGIGVSGAAPHEDEEVAAAALEVEGFAFPEADVAMRAALGHSR
ncbi:MAG: heme-binding protein [Deltaproteobacteria bacterium]|nr:heme-binding protein [Deltaproteobacteria bacterium]